MKERLDVLLVKKGFYPSREKAKAAIMAGVVYADGQKSDKAGNMIHTGAEISVRQNPCPYVSRGGLKLDKAMEEFGLSVEGRVCMDAGASTGGFTDCMLSRGAAKVYAIDVGYGQLDYKLRCDSRVVSMERCNIRYLDAGLIKEPVDFIAVDVSFISLKHIFPVAVQVLSDEGGIVCLVKPQFEAGRGQVGKKGIVRDNKVREETIGKTVGYAAENGLYPSGLTFSPIKGAKGNIEYLLYLSKTVNLSYNSSCIHDIVIRSHRELEQKAAGPGEEPK